MKGSTPSKGTPDKKLPARTAKPGELLADCSPQSEPNTAPADPTRLAKLDADKIRAQLRRWQERLLDLSKSNPLLGVNRSRVSKLRITRPEAALVFTQFVLEEQELRMPLVRKEFSTPPPEESLEGETRAPKLHLEAGDVECDAAVSDLMHRLRRIYDNARTTIEERGVTTLYLTFGALLWRDEVLGDSVSPLWMVPCQLTRKGPNTALRLSLADEEMQLNPALDYYLRERHKVTLPRIADQIAEDPDAGSLAEFLAAVRRAVREYRWDVTEEVWLSTFTFESLVIYQDLKAMADIAVMNPVVGAARLRPPSERKRWEMTWTRNQRPK